MQKSFVQYISFFLKAIRQRGLPFLLVYFRESVWFDLKYKVFTNSRVPKSNQTIISSDSCIENGLLYVASFTSVTIRTLSIAQSLFPYNFKNFQFLDLGCGKGKTLLIFSKMFGHLSLYPAIGIEYDPNLVSIAKSNIAKNSFSIDNAKIYCDSAVNCVNYIDAEVLVVYIYNSFQGKTFDEVLSSIAHIPHILIYIDPVELNILNSYDYSLLDENKGAYNANTWVVAMSSCFKHFRF